MNDKPSPQQEDAREQLRRQFSEEATERILQPFNMRPIDRPDGYARAEKEDGDRIAECTFTAQACAASAACAQAVTELAGGRSLQQALVAVTIERILELLGGLPPANVHCARDAVDLFRTALSDALQMRKDSWKIAYRKI
ncbi:MAG TPA: iron-sulfur cluster assembly scaffold protein [Acidobacteriota bacterium]